MRTSNLSLETLAAGAAQELFEDALKEVVANIHDINCDGKAQRKLTLEFTFKPNERDRSNCVIGIKAKPTLAPRSEFITDLRLGIDEKTGELEIGYQSKNRRIEELLDRKEKISEELNAMTNGDEAAQTHVYRVLNAKVDAISADAIKQIFGEDEQ